MNLKRRQGSAATRGRAIVSSGLLLGGLLTSCLLALLLIAMVSWMTYPNPMLLAFLFRFDVVNESGETVWITPIGAIDREGERRVLAQYTEGGEAIPAGQERNQKVQPGETLRIVYDWDDINFSEILVRDAAGNGRVLVVDATPTVDQFHSPESNRFVIPQLDSLAPAPADVAEAVEWQPAITDLVWRRALIVVPFLVPVGFLVLWYWTRRRWYGAPDRTAQR